MLKYQHTPAELEQHAIACYAELSPKLTRYAPLSRQESCAIACSEFVYETLFAHPEYWGQLKAQLNIFEPSANYAQLLAEQLPSVVDEASLMRCLRQFYRKALLGLAWQQIHDYPATTKLIQSLSDLAEQIILVAQTWIYRDFCQQWGTPCDAIGNKQPLITIAMGKLGGKELNFSSDIDLIFCYPLAGRTHGAVRHCDNQQFFTKLAQKLLRILSESTAEGSLYRVDMRLRPFGDSGPLVCSFMALEHYYQEQGRDWERYAWVKGRLLGESRYHQELQQLLHPFIYRRYIDFGMIQALAEMRQMIEREVRQREWHNNIKLGQGGIREMEFIVQLFQLIRGGREPRLRQTQFIPALQQIAELGLLAHAETQFLEHYYLFLRRLENLIQGIQAAQCHALPSDQDSLNQQRLYYLMGFADWSSLHRYIVQNSQRVRGIFDQLLLPQRDPSKPCYPEKYRALWLDQLSSREIQALFAINTSQANQLMQMIQHTQQELTKKSIGVRGRTVLDKLIPQIAYYLDQAPHDLMQIEILFNIILKIASRTTYLELLLNYPNALQQLIALSTASRFMAQQFVHYPILLDELLRTTSELQQAEQHYYQQQLQQKLLRSGEPDAEQYLILLHEFKQSQQLHLAIAELRGSLHSAQVAQHLTWLAEAILYHLIRQAWQDIVQRYGLPDHLTQDSEAQGFIILGYGKLGTSELNYHSDLDLVFLFDATTQGYTTGAKSIETRQFYFRLVQRLLHLCAVRISSQELYKVDLQLRAHGAAGTLIMPLEAWRHYQLNTAWCWEHQALVKARTVYGDVALSATWEQYRIEVLSYAVSSNLKTEMATMRNKMLQHYQPKDKTCFQLKYSSGGLNDLEFILQYWVLVYGKQYPSLFSKRATSDLCAECVALNLIPEAIASRLLQIHHYYLHLINQTILQDCLLERSFDADLITASEWVTRYWEQLMNAS